MAKEPGRFVLGKEERYLITQPKVVPEKLLSGLAILFSSAPFVEEAFFGQIHTPSQNIPPHPLIQVRLVGGSENKFDELSPKIGNLVETSLPSGQSLDIWRLQPGDDPISSLIRFYPKRNKNDSTPDTS
jgi:hypothetical protein